MSHNSKDTGGSWDMSHNSKYKGDHGTCHTIGRIQGIM